MVWLWNQPTATFRYVDMSKIILHAMSITKTWGKIYLFSKWIVFKIDMAKYIYFLNVSFLNKYGEV